MPQCPPRELIDFPRQAAHHRPPRFLSSNIKAGTRDGGSGSFMVGELPPGGFPGGSTKFLPAATCQWARAERDSTPLGGLNRPSHAISVVDTASATTLHPRRPTLPAQPARNSLSRACVRSGRLCSSRQSCRQRHRWRPWPEWTSPPPPTPGTFSPSPLCRPWAACTRRWSDSL